MDSKTVAIIGAASSLDGLSLRDCWNGPMGGGCGPENPPPGASTLVEVVAAALEDAGSRGPFAFQQTIGVACAGADPAAIATALRLDGPRESGNDLLDLLSLASAHVLRRAADTMVVCVAEGRDNAAVVLRRYRESWRSGLHLYALVRGCGVTDALPTSTTMLEIVDSCEVPGSGQVEACWVGSWSRGGKSAAIHAMASLLRTALAVHDRILPTSFPRGEERSLPPGRHFMTAAPRPWFHGNELRPRRAAVVQGSRAALLEEPPRSYLDSIRRKADAWPCELFLLAAPDRTALLERVRQLATLLAGEMPRLSDLAGALAAADLGGPCRLAMLASTAEALRALLHTAEEKLADPSTTRLRMPGAIYFGDGSTAPDRVALLFPGNGSQYVGMLHDVCLALPSVQAWLDYFDESLADGGMTPSQVFYPTPGLAVDPEHPVARKLLTLAETGGQATVMVSLALNELLVELRVPHDVVAGFSIGEVSALVASDVLRLRQARDILSAISELVVRPTDLIHGERPRYPLLVVQLPERKLLDEVLAASSEALYVALDCCPSQVVLCGSEKAIAAAEERLRAAGATTLSMPWDRGYHTPMFAENADVLRKAFASMDVGPGHAPVYSSITLQPFPAEPPAIRELLLSQFLSGVRFRELVPVLYEAGVRTFVEVGPSNRLTGFVRDSLRGKKHTALPCNVEGRSGVRQLLEVLASLFAGGHAIDPAPLFACRFLDPVSSLMPAPARVEAVGDGRAWLVGRHLALMNKFLTSQERVHAMVFGGEVPPETDEAPAPVQPVVAERPWPLLQHAPAHDGTFLSVDLTLDLDSLPVIEDHCLGNRPSIRRRHLRALPVVPFALAVELMAEVAECLATPRVVASIEDVRALRWLALDGGDLRVAVDARRLDADTVETRLCQVTDDPREPRPLAYSAVARLADSLPQPPPPLEIAPIAPRPLLLSAATYYSIAFHGPSLRAIRTVTGMAEDRLEGELVSPPTDGLVRGVAAPAFCTELVLQDNSGQLVGYWLSEQVGYVDIGLYPFRMHRYARYAAPRARTADRSVVRATVAQHGRQTFANMDMIDATGTVLGRVEGFESRIYHFPRRLHEIFFFMDAQTRISDALCEDLPEGVRLRIVDTLPAEYMEQSWGIWQRVLAHVVLGADERERWALVPDPERLPWLLARIAAKEVVCDWAADRDVALQQADVEIDADLQPAFREMSYLGAVPRLAMDARGDRAAAVLVERGARAGLAIALAGQEDAAALLAAARATAASGWRIVAREDRRAVVEGTSQQRLDVHLCAARDVRVAVCLAAACSSEPAGQQASAGRKAMISMKGDNT